MMYLDIVNALGTDVGPKGDRFMRVRDDRFPGEELLIPVADIEANAGGQSEDRNFTPLALMPGLPLPEPF